MNKNRFLYSWVRPKSGCDFHRILCPFRWVGEEPEFLDLDIDLSVNDPVNSYSYYMTQGPFPLHMLPELGKWKRQGSKVILSIDDDYFTIPDWSPAKLKPTEENHFYINLELADIIITSTDHLAKTINRPNKTLIAPNLMQVDDYATLQPAPVKPGESLRILWAGSATHSGDLELVVDAVDKILQKYKYPAVEFIFVGYCPDKLLKKYLGRGVHFENGVTLDLYPKVLNQIRPHITLAPLANIEFNLSKSNIRCLEAAALSSAVIASPVGEYRKVNSGFDGLLATTTDSWFEALDVLISKREYREYLAVNARKRVAEEFSWENPKCREPWRILLRELVNRSKS